jgi:hypothetical protein
MSNKEGERLATQEEQIYSGMLEVKSTLITYRILNASQRRAAIVHSKRNRLQTHQQRPESVQIQIISVALLIISRE